VINIYRLRCVASDEGRVDFLHLSLLK
jgi:hypothetical protein